jgi:lysophospholipase L1-like esterase
MRHLALAVLVLAGCGGSSEDAPVSAEETSTLADTSVATTDSGGTVDETTAVDSTTDDTSVVVTDSAMDAPVDAGPPAVRFIGRFTNDADPKFAWSGSAVRARFTGTGVKIKLGGAANQFAYVIDGAAPKLLKMTSGVTTYTLAAGLPAGEHEVYVHRRNEAFFGDNTFLGFEFDAGALLPPPPQKPRRLEIIGDSITCGYGNEGKDQYCMFTADTENHYLTYGAIAARNLDADIHVQSWSGMGMYRDYGGSTTDQMPVRWVRTLPNSTASTWDTSKYQPHAVIINLGTNDFAKGDPGKPFETAYLGFVKKLRTAYPSAWIFPAVGPMLSGTSLTQARTYLNNVINTLKAEGDTKVSLIEFATQSATDGYGCDWHPSLATNAKMATVLETALKSKLGW